MFVAVSTATAWADDSYLASAKSYYQQGQYFRAARYGFAAAESDPASAAAGYSWVTLSLSRAHLYNAASYFFIKTLQSGDKTAIRAVLTQTQDLLFALGPDLIRKYLIRHTQYEDYDGTNRSAYLFALGKDALLAHQEGRAIGYLNGVQKSSPFWPFSLELRASAHAIKGESDSAVQDFRLCVDHASQVKDAVASDTERYKQATNEAEDLKNRCQAGIARVRYEQGKFEEADVLYDHIQKSSLVWPGILFEQAWNAFARKEYNRSLGKLVSYKSPALRFVFNPEIDVLRAQSFLALCLYSDANDVINEFNGHYTKIGEEVKKFVEENAHRLEAFYDAGKSALKGPLDSQKGQSGMAPMLNAFVRGPYFTGLVRSEHEIASELKGTRQFSGGSDPGKGFPGFLELVLRWRLHTVKTLGGMYVKNSLIDYHGQLIDNYEKMAFIKLEMLKRAKEQLVYKSKAHSGERGWGNVEPERKDYQYYWSFNGEFWDDELGDYVFGLESECEKTSS